MIIDFSTISPAASYALLTQAVVPRPVAWMLTENDSGSFNLAPFSYFNIVSARPPILMVSIGRKPDGQDKDTRHNLEQRSDCVIHIAHRELAESVTASSATLERDESEIDVLELETVEWSGSRLPRLKSCRLACEARLIDEKQVHQQWVAFLELKRLYLDEQIIAEDAKGRLRIDAASLDPLARLGGGEYLLAGDIVDIPRPV